MAATKKIIEALENDLASLKITSKDEETKKDDASNTKTATVEAPKNDTEGVEASNIETANDSGGVEASNTETASVKVPNNATEGAESSKKVNYVHPIKAMFGAKSPWRAPEFPLIVPSSNHAVLYRIPSNGLQDGPPLPMTGHDKWDSNHVRMPCSENSLYETEGVSGSRLQARWKMIETALTRNRIRSSRDLAKAILAYNTKFKRTWTFAAMHEYFEEYLDRNESRDFFKYTMPAIVKLALDLPKLIQAPIPLLKKETNKSISLSQQQIACLLANAFFCTFPRRNTTGPGSEYAAYPRINFIDLYDSDAEGIMEKLNCISNYFVRVCKSVPTGVVTFSRRSVATPACPDWKHSDVRINSVPLYVDDRTTIEEAEGLIQVNFSNKYLGGDVLDNGLVQQEIRFLICPELMASMLFTEVLGPNEAIMIIGCEWYNNYTGYGCEGFLWTGDFHDRTPYDGSGRRRCAVLAIDALVYEDEWGQYHRDKIYRELNKAWIGFSFHTDPKSNEMQYPGVATGNWGCGAFNGSPQLKALIQLMACAQARRPIAYLTFKDASLKDEVIKVYSRLKRHSVTVGELFDLLMQYCNSDSDLDLHAYIKKELKKKPKPAPVQPAPSTSGNSSLDP